MQLDVLRGFKLEDLAGGKLVKVNGDGPGQVQLRIEYEGLVEEDPDGQVPLQGATVKLEPHWVVLELALDAFREVFLHLKANKDYRNNFNKFYNN